jgi:hypothetical protein
VALAWTGIVTTALCRAQDDLGQDVDDLVATGLTPTTSRLTWKPVSSVECETAVTYSVFRGTHEGFTPSLSNRVASGLTKTTYIAHEPKSSDDYYYAVSSVTTPAPCLPHSGEVRVYPLDLGQDFEIIIGKKAGVCTARSPSELSCTAPMPKFHAVIVEQGAHEYLIGCDSNDYEGGSGTCTNLSPRLHHVEVHSRTLIFGNSGMAETNTKNGKQSSSITPVFSVLARLK